MAVTKLLTQKVLTVLAVVLVAGTFVSVGALTYRSPGPLDKTRVLDASQTSPVRYSGQEGKTILQLLEDNAQVRTRDAEQTRQVEAINGISNGTNDKYWVFYVNGQRTDEPADTYVTKNNEVIEWRLE